MVLVVSGIGIMNIMFDTVRERIREIGIRRACGATRGDIALEFVSQAVVISLVGRVQAPPRILRFPSSYACLPHFTFQFLAWLPASAS